MAAFLQAQGITGRALQRELDDLCLGADRETAEPKLLDPGPAREADLAWQVRAWGRRVLAAARRRLAGRYPTYAEFRPLKPGGRPFTERRRELLVPDAEGNTSVGRLNEEFDAVYLKDRRNPRWVADAGRRVPLGAHGPLQGVPRDDPAAQDPLAGEEGRQARAADAGAGRGRHRRRVRDRGRRAAWRRQRRAAARARQADRRRHDEPVRRASARSARPSRPCRTCA